MAASMTGYKQVTHAVGRFRQVIDVKPELHTRIVEICTLLQVISTCM